MKSYSEYLQEIFPGVKVQKISVNAGFSCPNRDGTIGTGGCSYCRNDSFSPSYCMNADLVKVQIQNGKQFFARKYPQMKFLAYFQSYTNTYGRDVAQLRKLYDEALECEDVVGLVIGTRPDTLPDEVLEMLGDINHSKPVFLEIGAETSNDETLRRINRHHTWQEVKDAVTRAAAHGLRVGLHLIAGLPGEDPEQILANVDEACRLPIETLKLHQLQILRDTAICKEYESGDPAIKPFELEEYLNLCVEICRRVPERVVIERFLSQSPPSLVVAPKWGMKNYQFHDQLAKLLKVNNKSK